MTSIPFLLRHRSLGALVVLPALLIAHGAAGEPAAPWAALRAARIRQLTGSDERPFSPERTAGLQQQLRSMETAADRRTLWAEKDFNDKLESAQSVYLSLVRLRDLAVAWQTAGSPIRHDPAAAERLKSATLWLVRHHYHAAIPYDGNQTRWGNWWPWQIGAPRALVDLVILLHEVFSPAEREELFACLDHYCPAPNVRVGGGPIETGANLMNKISIQMLRGIAGERADKLEEAKRFLPAIFAWRDAVGGDGYYSDGTFIQHDHFIYTNAYGVDLFTRVVPLLELVAGTPWRFADADVRTVAQLALLAHDGAVVDGKLLPSFQGRGISFGGNPWATSVAESLRRLSNIITDAALAAEVRDAADRMTAAIERGSPGRTAARRTGDPAAAAPEKPRVQIFRFGDRVVARQPAYRLDIAMYSSRRADYESFNGNNYQGWHLADGMTYLFTADPEQWAGDYWATADMLRLPGTTVLSRTPGAQAVIRFPAEVPAGGAWVTVDRSQPATLRATVKSVESGAALVAEFPPLPRPPMVDDKFTTIRATLRVYGQRSPSAPSESSPVVLVCVFPHAGQEDPPDPATTDRRREVDAQLQWHEFDVTEEMRWVQTSAGRIFDFPATLRLAANSPATASFTFAATGENAPQLILRINRNPLTSDASWVGGSVYDTRFAAVGMQLRPPGFGLEAKKSWFLFDREIVALGADIRSSTPDVPVETSLWDQLLRPDNGNTLLVDGRPLAASAAESGYIDAVRTVWLGGNRADSSVGVYFPEPTSLRSFRGPRTGRLGALAYRRDGDAPVTRWRHALWIDHGVRPQAGTYAYILLPETSPAALADYAGQSDVEILENSPRAQLVHHRRLGLLAANLWSSEAVPIRNPASGTILTLYGPGSLILRETVDAMEIAAADPTHENHPPLVIQADRPLALVHSVPGVSLQARAGLSTITIALAGTQGRTIEIQTRKALLGAP